MCLSVVAKQKNKTTTQSKKKRMVIKRNVNNSLKQVVTNQLKEELDWTTFKTIQRNTIKSTY